MTTTPHPTAAQVNALHAKYIKALTKLYADHAPKYGNLPSGETPELRIV